LLVLIKAAGNSLLLPSVIFHRKLFPNMLYDRERQEIRYWLKHEPELEYLLKGLQKIVQISKELK
jgi:hypothetical protein